MCCISVSEHLLHIHTHARCQSAGTVTPATAELWQSGLTLTAFSTEEIQDCISQTVFNTVCLSLRSSHVMYRHGAAIQGTPLIIFAVLIIIKLTTLCSALTIDGGCARSHVLQTCLITLVLLLQQRRATRAIYQINPCFRTSVCQFRPSASFVAACVGR